MVSMAVTVPGNILWDGIIFPGKSDPSMIPEDVIGNVSFKP